MFGGATWFDLSPAAVRHRGGPLQQQQAGWRIGQIETPPFGLFENRIVVSGGVEAE